ncbi:DNA invertase Pin-like site-specific DNA recombinase [Archangium gephyra]|uniref:DNA invertase Pin-like site-specific DNA recombinase n=1 Tax=Archangium gephyra TaxID=48 RepID=A0ABX9JQA8_9BACT|nr:recombinase family protein [Archangium gephyra]REG24416.1 DNA invertase Pin-like site-specific DNA recombinase [Archangium gephyra]
MPRAYSYLRFSTPEQMKGDSFRRQTDAARKYASAHGLELDDKLTFNDLGKSAYRGSNMEAGGQLNAFLTAVQDRKVEPGSYLLMESLDRMSRQAPMLALGPLTMLLQLGITVVTLNDGQVYSLERMMKDNMALMYALMGFIRAHDESEHKSFRLKGVWSQKRLKASEKKPMTANVPTWLRLDKETGKIHVIEEYAGVVRRIFRDYLDGRGAAAIVKALNREGVPVFSREGRNGLQAKRWHLSYIRRILDNPAVIGAFTTHTTEHDGRKKTRRKAGDPIPGYFPAIVDEDTFKRVQALRLGTHSPLRGKNANRGDLKNLFGGLIRCGRCDSAMHYVNKGRSKAGRKYVYLLCAKARYGAGCTFTLVPYERVESTFIDKAPQVLVMAPGDFENTELHEEIRQVETTLEAIGYKLSDLAEAYAQTKLQTLFVKMKELEDEQKELGTQRDNLHHRAGIVEDRSVTKRIGELEEALQSATLDRRKVNALMRMVFSEVTLNPDTCTVDVTWKNGIRGESLLYWFPTETAKAA